ncbi:MAG: hypothetical protein AAF214_05675 [Pseudomonadota bacterium]
MHRCYGDILDRIGTPPLWFDEGGVPRFDPFAPDLVDIYAREAVLVRIECQACRAPFEVAFTNPAASKPLPDGTADGRRYPLLRDYIMQRVLHYGDPPNVWCCDAGPSMNSVPRTVLQYWVKPHVLGEGLGCGWPRRRTAGPDSDFHPAHPTLLDVSAMKFRRDTTLEGIDLTPDWAR